MNLPTIFAQAVRDNEVWSAIATGAICRLNLFFAALGMGATLTLEDKAKIFAAVATGVWFITQTVLAIVAAVRKRKRGRDPN